MRFCDTLCDSSELDHNLIIETRELMYLCINKIFDMDDFKECGDMRIRHPATIMIVGK